MILFDLTQVTRADTGGTIVWVVIIAVWLLLQAVGAARRGRRAQAAAAQQVATPTVTPTAQVSTIRMPARVLRGAARSAPTTSDIALSQTMQLRDAAMPTPATDVAASTPTTVSEARRSAYTDLLAQLGGLTTRLEVPQTPVSPAAALPTPEILGTQAIAGTAPIPGTQAAVRNPIVAPLFAPRGVAFAVLATAILGTPVALRSQPQEPGGW